MKRTAISIVAFLLLLWQQATAELVNLNIQFSDYTAQDGDLLVGKLPNTVKLTIADGATVTISGMRINGRNSEDCPWAGINCEGDATIVVAGMNFVRGYYEDYPGIYVPGGHTLTFRGTGSLEVENLGKGAAIGTGYGQSCGNIVIDGGTFITRGGNDAAAIGSASNGTCGNITINDGEIEAQGGGENSVGIGWWSSSEGTVSITGGKVKAAGPQGAIAAYGGSVSIEGCQVWAGETEEAAVFITPSERLEACKDNKFAKLETCQHPSIVHGSCTSCGYEVVPHISLANNADNSSIITKNEGNTIPLVVLTDRTLWKDGKWNTLCLPFDVIDGDANDGKSFSGTPLEGAIVRTIESASFSGYTLKLNFSNELSRIPAGLPCFIKWEGDGTENIIEPEFENVTISTDDNSFEDENVISFLGTYKPFSIEEGGDKTILYLGDDNKLYYPTEAMSIGAQRAYFILNNGLTAGEPLDTDANSIKTFVLNFGDEETGISEIHLSNSSNTSNLSETFRDSWFTLSGTRLTGKPSRPGLYIHNDSKVLIK